MQEPVQINPLDRPYLRLLWLSNDGQLEYRISFNITAVTKQKFIWKAALLQMFSIFSVSYFSCAQTQWRSFFPLFAFSMRVSFCLLPAIVATTSSWSISQLHMKIKRSSRLWGWTSRPVCPLIRCGPSSLTAQFRARLRHGPSHFCGFWDRQPGHTDVTGHGWKRIVILSITSWLSAIYYFGVVRQWHIKA